MEKRYLIIPSSRVSEIEFEQVLEDGPTYLRYSLDDSKTFIKWIGETPDCVNNIFKAGGDYWGPYKHEEIIEILSREEWTSYL